MVKAPYLRLPSGRNYAGTLRHELVHVLLHRNVGEDRIPRWFNEGLAMMLANEYACGAPLSVARMYIERRIIPYSHLDFSLMAPGTETEFGDAYAQSLSMTRYLRNELGEETFWALIRDSGPMGFPDALRKHAGKSAVAFWQDYAASPLDNRPRRHRGIGLLFLAHAFPGALRILPQTEKESYNIG